MIYALRFSRLLPASPRRARPEPLTAVARSVFRSPGKPANRSVCTPRRFKIFPESLRTRQLKEAGLNEPLPRQIGFGNRRPRTRCTFGHYDTDDVRFSNF